MCEKDATLKRKFIGHNLVLQKKIPIKEIFCDIEEDEDIPNESELRCIFEPMEKNDILPSMPEKTKIFEVTSGGELVEVEEVINTQEKFQIEQKVKNFKYFK